MRIACRPSSREGAANRARRHFASGGPRRQRLETVDATSAVTAAAFLPDHKLAFSTGRTLRTDRTRAEAAGSEVI